MSVGHSCGGGISWKENVNADRDDQLGRTDLGRVTCSGVCIPNADFRAHSILALSRWMPSAPNPKSISANQHGISPPRK